MKNWIFIVFTLSMITISCQTDQVEESIPAKTELRYVNNDRLVTDWINLVISYLNTDESKKQTDSTKFDDEYIVFGEVHGGKGFDYQYERNKTNIHFGKNEGVISILRDSKFTQPEINRIFMTNAPSNRSEMESIIGKKFSNDTLTIEGENGESFHFIFLKDGLEKIEFEGFKIN